MQDKFRVEAWRCHLSHELEAHSLRRSRQKSGLSQNIATPNSHHLRKGFEKLSRGPHPMQQDR